jgi:hypothetical protein
VVALIVKRKGQYRRYTINDLDLLVLKILFSIVFFPFILLLKFIKWRRKVKQEKEEDEMLYQLQLMHDDCREEEEIEMEIKSINQRPDLPDMAQIFSISGDTLIGVQFVSMCPDETAHIRIIGEDTFSQLYRRKVYYEKGYPHDRYINVSGQRYYLDPKKTRPITIQAKEGK